MDWQPLGPATFPAPVLENGRRIAKDDDFLNAVQEMWKEEHANAHDTEYSPFDYISNEETPSTTLYGHVLRRKKEQDSEKLPVVLFFHTGAGPQDVFLFYKADMLLQSLDCIVLICDTVSDEKGWAWGPNRDHYNAVRAALLENDAQILRRRVSSAVTGIVESNLSVDPHKLAAMGWCMGGQPMLELPALIDSSVSIQSMITFHGVFGRQPPIAIPKASTTTTTSKVLMCNGQEDPFVAPQDLKHATEYFEALGCQVEVYQAPGAKHGFTNKAQDCNPNPNFVYNAAGAETSWNKALLLLQTTLA